METDLSSLNIDTVWKLVLKAVPKRVFGSPGSLIRFSWPLFASFVPKPPANAQEHFVLKIWT
jgi:hypothetical protein